MPVLLKFKNLTKVFGKTKALENISFDVNEGDFLFICGPSGAGKTTLIKLVLRDLIADSGEVMLAGQSITKLSDKEVPTLRQQVGVVFQDFKVLSERTVRENVEVALAVIGLPSQEWKPRVDRVLKLVGLFSKRRLFPSQLSGGELQRLSLARALVVNPKVLIADEPTGNLDWETADKLMDLLEKINREGKTILMVTHHRLIVEKRKKRTIELKDGKIVSDSGQAKKEKISKNEESGSKMKKKEQKSKK
ncbi:ATP-binding cassette domain-containing protein [bacterium]|nr:ATP-binding cassette domain-containing protein [bacterium]